MEPQNTVYELLRNQEPKLTGIYFITFCVRELTKMYNEKKITAKLYADTMVLVERYF